MADLDGSGRDNTNVLSGMSGATGNNHEHHVAIDRVASGIRTPPSTRLGRYHYANLFGEMTFVISWQHTKFKNDQLPVSSVQPLSSPLAHNTSNTGVKRRTAYLHPALVSGLSALTSLSWHLTMGQMGRPETSARNYQYSLNNNPKERRSRLLRGGSLKSRKGWVCSRCGMFQTSHTFLAITLAWFASVFTFSGYNTGYCWIHLNIHLLRPQNSCLSQQISCCKVSHITDCRLYKKQYFLSYGQIFTTSPYSYYNISTITVTVLCSIKGAVLFVNLHWVEHKLKTLGIFQRGLSQKAFHIR